MDRPIIDVLVWLRTPADIIFAVGALLVATMVASLWLAPGRPREDTGTEAQAGNQA